MIISSKSVSYILSYLLVPLDGGSTALRLSAPVCGHAPLSHTYSATRCALTFYIYVHVLITNCCKIICNQSRFQITNYLKFTHSCSYLRVRAGAPVVRCTSYYYITAASNLFR